MVEARHLFDGYDMEHMHNNRIHIWEMVCLLGAPPQTFLNQSPHTWRMFDDQGTPLDPLCCDLADMKQVDGKRHLPSSIDHYKTGHGCWKEMIERSLSTLCYVCCDVYHRIDGQHKLCYSILGSKMYRW